MKSKPCLVNVVAFQNPAERRLLLESSVGVSFTTLAAFMEAAQGNYRNALYIHCSVCLYSREAHCGDFLFIANYDGTPILLPKYDAEQFIGHAIDSSECIGIISNRDFTRLYHKWLILNTSTDDICPYHQILHFLNEPDN